MEDQKILELIRNNKSDKAFEKLYRYYPAIKKMIIANGGRSEDAEDLFQEALIVFYKKASDPSFTLTSSCSTYVYSICRFMWLAEGRKIKKNLKVELSEHLIPDPEFENVIQQEEQYRQAEQAIMSLGERCRELLIQFYFYSVKLKDLALKMGYNSENTAKNQKYKCLETAKIKLKALRNQSTF